MRKLFLFLAILCVTVVNAADEIKITSLSNGQRFDTCSTITISAEVNITGDINRVYF